MKMKYLFCNVGWMERYQGNSDQDRICGGGSYVKNRGIGHEVCNFLPVEGWVYGYVQPINNKSIDLNRIDENANSNKLNDVLVIWTATQHKKLGGGTYVVGWYKNATVFREFQDFDTIPTIQNENGISRYLVKAKEKDVTLLPINERTLFIPRGVKGGIGQSNVWYADQEANQDIINKVLNFIKQHDSPSSNQKNRTKPNQERKVQVEKNAIQVCWTYFESLGYELKSVETDNVGWDLEATAGKLSLRIEVKGLSGTAFSVGLTPNEYGAFSANKEDYRLAVVTDALNSPKLSICRYSSEKSDWVVETKGEEDRLLNITPIMSATISCS